MLEVKQLTKAYGKTIANDNINFTIPDQRVALLVGPNGAGKSTLLKSIMGLLRYSGDIRIDGLQNKTSEAREKLGYVPEIPHLYPLLTVEEHLEFVARVYKLKDWKGYADALLARFELEEQRHKLGAALSKGMQQKVSICTALLPRPAFLLFDEPLVGLDPHAIKELKLCFRELADAGHSLLISTHILDSVDEIWDQVLIMMNGHLVVNLEKAELDKDGRKLEDFFFEITETSRDHAGIRRSFTELEATDASFNKTEDSAKSGRWVHNDPKQGASKGGILSSLFSKKNAKDGQS